MITRLLFYISICIGLPFMLISQVVSFPYSESFDKITAPALPLGWNVIGFKDTISGPYSNPNCIYATGNTTAKFLTSPAFNFTNRVPDKLIFREKRSSTAANYRLEICASLDGTIFNKFLASFDSISSTAAYVQRVVALSGSGLQNQPDVRFQWHLLADCDNNTGILRIDDISLTLATGSDIELTSMTVYPPAPSRKDTLTIAVVIKNNGTLPASDYSVHFYLDKNNNGVGELDEKFSDRSGLFLAPGDSLTCAIIHPPIQTGESKLIAVLDMVQDENRVNDTVSTAVRIQSIKGDILVNEIMYAPSGDEDEWVELYNASPDSINLKNWKISDSNISSKNLISITNLIIAPGSYIVISKDVNFSAIHPGVAFVTANFPALNNSTADAVVIYDDLLRVMDSVMYQPNWGGQNGKSLERIDLNELSTSFPNWGTSLDSLGCTPGKINSIVKLNYDLCVSRLWQTRNYTSGKMIPVVNVTIRNIGKKIADSVTVNFYASYKHELDTLSQDLIRNLCVSQNLNTNDSLNFSEPLPQLASGEITVSVAVEFRYDERMSNNLDSIVIRNNYEPYSLLINEIMYDPLEGQNEWFELYNNCIEPVDLRHWTFNDKSASGSNNLICKSDSPMVIQPGSFAVIAADSSIFNIFPYLINNTNNFKISVLDYTTGFGFNTDGDAVVLKDLTGRTIDSISYMPDWHNPDAVDTHGRSLERINPNLGSNDSRNWSTCTNIAGGSPGKVNSIKTTGSTAGSNGISLSPNPFSPDGDGFEDYCIVQYKLTMIAATVMVKIYDIKGRCIRTLANGEYSGSKGEFIWNGFDENNQRARIGVYIVYLEACDRSSGRVERAKAVAVVAAKF